MAGAVWRATPTSRPRRVSRPPGGRPKRRSSPPRATSGSWRSTDNHRHRKGAPMHRFEIVAPSMIRFGAGSTRSLHVLGMYGDGVQRDLTEPSTGTTYETSRPEIASVSPEGLVTAGSPGAATVVARNAGHQTSTGVTVL